MRSYRLAGVPERRPPWRVARRAAESLATWEPTRVGIIETAEPQPGLRDEEQSRGEIRITESNQWECRIG